MWLVISADRVLCLMFPQRKMKLFVKRGMNVLTSLLIGLLVVACGSQIPATENPATEPVRLPTQFAPQPSPDPAPTLTLQYLPVNTSTPEHGIDDLSDYYGGLVITLDHVGQTIDMIPGQGFLLRLGDEYAWTISIEPADLLTINRNITPELTEQGVYIARKKGRAYLSALGVPGCKTLNPPCSRPNVLYRLNININ